MRIAYLSIDEMASLKTKGDLAELKVAADLVERGYRIALPFGEDVDFDLILIRGQALERVQVKYACSDGEVIAPSAYGCSERAENRDPLRNRLRIARRP